MRASHGLTFRSLSLVALTLLFASAVFAQYGLEGVPPYTVQIPVPHGFISATTGHLHLEIPIASIPERNGDPLFAKMVYDSNSFTYSVNGWSYMGSTLLSANSMPNQTPAPEAMAPSQAGVPDSASTNTTSPPASSATSTAAGSLPIPPALMRLVPAIHRPGMPIPML